MNAFFIQQNRKLCDCKAKYKYRGMIETQKVRRQDKFRNEWSQH